MWAFFSHLICHFVVSWQYSRMGDWLIRWDGVVSTQTPSKLPKIYLIQRIFFSCFQGTFFIAVNQNPSFLPPSPCRVNRGTVGHGAQYLIIIFLILCTVFSCLSCPVILFSRKLFLYIKTILNFVHETHIFDEYIIFLSIKIKF